MNRAILLKVFGIVTVALVVANLILFTFHLYDWRVFWGVMAGAAFLAYVVLPRVKQ